MVILELIDLGFLVSETFLASVSLNCPQNYEICFNYTLYFTIFLHIQTTIYDKKDGVIAYKQQHRPFCLQKSELFHQFLYFL